MEYAAKVIPQIDAKIAEKGHFWMKTNYFILKNAPAKAREY
jgi:hypothetical protein